MERRRCRDSDPRHLTTFIKLQPDCLPLYVFDNPENHLKIDTDALNARKQNLNYGGENTPLIPNVYYKIPDGAIVVHTMQAEAVVQKGICTILTERGFWIPGMNKLQALQFLFQQDYFNPENLSLILDETVKSLGVWLELLPKYHPEFNFIEMYWGHIKSKVRNEHD